tara:strand:+ start:432 stop:653 length:222 start_codon:yes stop_codon:yes gene_type:complete
LKKIIFYSYSKCSTCRKAAKWLENKYLEYQLIKRPFLIYEEKKVILGFNEIEYGKQFIYGKKYSLYKFYAFFC